MEFNEYNFGILSRAMKIEIRSANVNPVNFVNFLCIHRVFPFGSKIQIQQHEMLVSSVRMVANKKNFYEMCRRLWIQNGMRALEGWHITKQLLCVAEKSVVCSSFSASNISMPPTNGELPLRILWNSPSLFRNFSARGLTSFACSYNVIGLVS